jgi:hypothetical protein
MQGQLHQVTPSPCHRVTESLALFQDHQVARPASRADMRVRRAHADGGEAPPRI